MQNSIQQNCTGATYKVGDVYPNTGPAQGVVIWVNGAAPGSGVGLAVALTDDKFPNPGIQWSTVAETLVGAQYSGLFSTNNTTFAGVTNTSQIIANTTDCPVDGTNCAAWQAYHHGGTTGVWHLPSQGELMLVWQLDAYNNSNTGTTTYAGLTNGGNSCYWSSTAYYATAVNPQPFPTTTPGATTAVAWALSTSTDGSGFVDDFGKTAVTCGVRAVRAFTY